MAKQNARKQCYKFSSVSSYGGSGSKSLLLKRKVLKKKNHSQKFLYRKALLTFTIGSLYSLGTGKQD